MHPLHCPSVLMRRPQVIVALILREIGARSGESRWSFLWSIGEPLGGIALLTIAFGIMLAHPPLGHNFALFYATGVLPFSLYSATAAGVANALSANRGLLAYPVVSILDAVLARWLLETASGIVLALGMIGGVIWFWELDLLLRPGRILSAFAAAACLGLGVGTINLLLFAFVPVWRNIWSILNRPLFLVSGVMYAFDGLPPDVRHWLALNPLVHVIGETRAGFYGQYRADYVRLPEVFLCAAALFVVGALLIRRHHARLIQN
jgi:capsular polysaccharide transport system permease protein